MDILITLVLIGLVVWLLPQIILGVVMAFTALIAAIGTLFVAGRYLLNKLCGRR
jgi:hypothetical protein